MSIVRSLRFAVEPTTSYRERFTSIVDVKRAELEVGPDWTVMPGLGWSEPVEVTAVVVFHGPTMGAASER